MQRNNFWLEIFFKSFELFWIFCRNLWHGSQNSIFVTRVKIPEEILFIFFFSEFFFGFWAKIFSDFWPKNFKKFSKLHSKCPEEQFVAWFFFKFWIALDFLQKPLAWFSNFYLRVQSKNSGRIIFFILLLSFFPDFERKKVQIFGQKTSRSCQNYPLRSQTSNFWIENFAKVLNRFGFSAETFGMVLKVLSTCPE